MSEEVKIQAGDNVKLKSDSPVMTVEWVSDDEAMCVWFNNMELVRQKICVAALTKY